MVKAMIERFAMEEQPKRMTPLAKQGRRWWMVQADSMDFPAQVEFR
jgi:hypothetical protein